MKTVKTIFSCLLVATLFAGLFLNSRLSPSSFESTEFLFDTTCTITVFSVKDKVAVTKAFDEAFRIHNLSNFFDPKSDVSKINSSVAGKQVAVDPDIISMLELAQEINQHSNGAFDISLAPVSMLWKFDTENPIPPSDAEIISALNYACKEHPVLDKSKNTVTKHFDETKFDLGGIAKGYAADRAAEVLKNNNVSSAIIDFGGNIITLGKNPKSSDGLWRIGLQKPFAQTGEYSKTLSVKQTAIATSGTYQRSFSYNGNLYHHILDPKTGKPATWDFSSVTVIAENSALADSLATAIFVLGKEKGTLLANEYNVLVEFLH